MKDANQILSPLMKKVALAPGAWLDNYSKMPLTILFPAMGLGGAALTLWLSKQGRAGLGFFTSALTLAGIILTAGDVLGSGDLPAHHHRLHHLELLQDVGQGDGRGDRGAFFGLLTEKALETSSTNPQTTRSKRTCGISPAEERWLRQQKHRGRPWLTLSILAGWAGVVVLAFQAWLLADIVTAIAFDGQDLASQRTPLLTLLALLPLRALLAWSSEHLATRGAVALKQQLRRLGGYFSRYLPAMAQMAAVPLTLLLFITPRDWLSALILLTTAPLIPFFMILIGKGAERRNQRQWRQLARMSAHFLDMIRGLPTLKLFNASRREAGVVARIADKYRRRTLSVLRIAFLSSFTLEFFATVSIAVVAVVIGFRLYWGEMSFLHGFFVLLLAPEFYLPLRNLGGAYHDRMEAIGAAGQLLEMPKKASASN